jgi:hypothetical protein
MSFSAALVELVTLGYSLNLRLANSLDWCFEISLAFALYLLLLTW